VAVGFAWFVALVAIALLASVSQSAGSGNDSAGAALVIGIATISILGIAITYFSIRGLGRWAKNG
jgi:hypothetical protein